MKYFRRPHVWKIYVGFCVYCLLHYASWSFQSISAESHHNYIRDHVHDAYGIIISREDYVGGILRVISFGIITNKRFQNVPGVDGNDLFLVIAVTVDMPLYIVSILLVLFYISRIRKVLAKSNTSISFHTREKQRSLVHLLYFQVGL